MQRVGDRGRRALVLIGIAAVAAGAAILVYLRPALAPDLPAPRPAPAAGPSWTISSASFGDAQHGAVDVHARGRVATFVTSDGGRTWRRVSTEAAVTTFLDRDHAVAVDLGPSDRFGISDDAGRTWRTVPQPTTLLGAPLDVRPSGPFFLDAADGWWFGPRPGTGQGTLWRTVDGGRTWSDLAPSGMPLADQHPLQPVFIDAVHGAVVIAADGPDVLPALLVTRDGGRSWRNVAPAWPAISAPSGQAAIVSPALLAHGDRLVLSLDVLVARSSGPSQQSQRVLSASEDGGATWGPWTQAPPALPIAALSFDDAGRLVLVDGTRLWSSTDLGHTWQSRTVTGPDGQRSTLISARGGMLLVARLPAPGGATAAALLRSVDGGGHWTEIALPPAPS
ncbi:MAG TPA: sialidase family protein [Candidatus Dormibacteraeota bacterium]